MDTNFNQNRSPENIESILSIMRINGYTVAGGKGNRQLGAVTPLGVEVGQYNYLVAKNNKNEGVYWVAGSESWLTEEVYESITEEAEAAGLASIYHVYSKLCLLGTEDVIWYQSAAN